MEKNDTNLPTKAPTKTSAHQCPPGLSFDDRPGRPSPFLARWRETRAGEGGRGKKKSKAFRTEEARGRFAIQWAALRDAGVATVPTSNPQDVETWRAFDRMTGGANPLEVARFWLKHHAEGIARISIEDAVSRFITLRQDACGRDTNSHTRLHLRRFINGMAGMQLGEITPELIRAWLGGLRNPDDGAAFEPRTLRHHLKTVRFLFDVAVRERWLDKSPAAAVDSPRVLAGDISVLSVGDAARLFEANREALCVARLALEAFGGLRFSSAARLSRSDIVTEEKGIVMPGAKHKSGRRQYVDGYPDNLWQWIERAPQACWDVPMRAYLDLKAEAFKRAGVVNPGNVLRHSFCSYHVALHKDAARTAVLLTHRSVSMLYSHYKGRASQDNGRRYFEILP